MEIVGAYQDRGGSKQSWSSGIQASPLPEGFSLCWRYRNAHMGTTTM